MRTLAPKTTTQMPSLLRIVAKIPLPQSNRLEWQRTLLDRAYARDIAAARKQKDNDKVEKLESQHRYEMELHEEDEDAYISKRLLYKARRLRVPIPRLHTSDGQESEHWHQSNYTGLWHLTNLGITSLRSEIRNEIKARHESRSHWVVWLSALTGVVGAITGLVAVIGGKTP
jgi:hypothetical protein